MTAYKINTPTGIYFITFSVVEWVDVFTRQRYRDIVIDSLRYCQQEKGLVIYAFVVMSNHLHLILASEGKETLSAILRDFKKYTASQILKSIQHEAESRRNWMLWIFQNAGKKNSNNTHYQFWQQNNHAEELITPKFSQQKLEYIHQNPVKAGLVESPEDYLYSSARNYTDLEGLVEVRFLT